MLLPLNSASQNSPGATRGDGLVQRYCHLGPHFENPLGVGSWANLGYGFEFRCRVRLRTDCRKVRKRTLHFPSLRRRTKEMRLHGIACITALLIEMAVA